MIKWSVYADQRQLVGDTDFEIAKNTLLDNLTFVMDTAHSSIDHDIFQGATRAYHDLLCNDQPNAFEDEVNGVHYSIQPS